MQIIASLVKVHGEQQWHQTKVMVSVQMTNEDVIDLMYRDLKLSQLHLRTLTAID